MSPPRPLLLQQEDQTWAYFSCPTSDRSAAPEDSSSPPGSGTSLSEHQDKTLPLLPIGVQEPEASPKTGTDWAAPSSAV